MARVVQYEKVGGPEVLEVVEVPDPTPSDDQVLVEVKAAGINPIDLKLRSGERPAPFNGPRRLGSDAAGVILEVGSAVSGWAPGDEVIVRGAHGADATQVVASAAQLVRKPASITWEQAAALGTPVSTAYQVLKSLEVGEGTTLLVHAGSGAVGSAAIQFAVAWGATVIATGSEANQQRMRDLGAIPTTYGPGLAERVRALAPGGVDVVFDAVGTDEALDASFELVPDRSHIGTIAAGARAADLGIRAWAGGSPVPLTPEEQALRAEAYQVVAGLLERGEFTIDVAHVYPLDEVAAAHRDIESGAVTGKVVLVP
ncbi:NADP-dependent oxidoreductase [Diaminobutyricibacter tongyongensis]|uniref:NADP-dependent oxidoreductase n=1 Tax=Leifsonia tongyongensis TaxID=1268043 RepID=A0A6L9XXN1_9MICO|nr:NADP-dependent oxidoreductase [Diaminobutyricibacter tongyongensis]NEN06005.1 NADP-dependent oxidoreductase [Diaminobutyricibacter tongyongensis]